MIFVLTGIFQHFQFCLFTTLNLHENDVNQQLRVCDLIILIFILVFVHENIINQCISQR